MEIDGEGPPAITRLLQLRVSAAEGLRREAATVLIDFLRAGHSAEEIVQSLEYVGPRLRDLAEEIRAVAAEIGIDLSEPD